MAGRLATSVIHNILDAVFGGVPLTNLPATVYLGLSTTLPTVTGSNVTEPTDSAYARIAVAKNQTNWPAASSRSISNGVTFSFPTASSGGSGYGSVGWVPMYSAATGGTFLGFLVITGGPVSIGAGVTADFPAGSLVWTAPSS